MLCCLLFDGRWSSLTEREIHLKSVYFVTVGLEEKFLSFFLEGSLSFRKLHPQKFPLFHFLTVPDFRTDCVLCCVTVTQTDKLKAECSLRTKTKPYWRMSFFGDILLFSFCLLDTGCLLFILIYFIITLSDLECDYLNAQECCAKLNFVRAIFNYKFEFIVKLCPKTKFLVDKQILSWSARCSNIVRKKTLCTNCSKWLIFTFNVSWDSNSDD